ncbi:MAG TPA: FAD:protein FMN transferase [Verrucomicrobiae bacterium]
MTSFCRLRATPAPGHCCGLKSARRSAVALAGRSPPILRAWFLLASSVLAVLLLAGCKSGPQTTPLRRFEFTHPAMGTLFGLTLFAADEASARSAAQAAFRRIDALEDIMSDYQAGSELMRLCEEPPGKPVPVSADLFDVLQRAQKIARASDGAFDITVGPYVRLWRFARKRKEPSNPTAMSAAAAAVGYEKIRLDPRTWTVTLLVPNMRLDLGGIAKGYAADAALRALKGRGVTRALVAASGDIALGDPPPGQRAWKVEISGLNAGTNGAGQKLLLHNCGISTSGDTEQSIEIGGTRYSHILNPRTGLGLTNRIQATVIAPDATTTDALATAVCVLGPHRGLALVESMPRTATSVFTKEGNQLHPYASQRFKKILKSQVAGK